jgi:hypothetical protein
MNDNTSTPLFSINRMWYGGLTMRLYYNEELVQVRAGGNYEFAFGWNNIKLKLEEQYLTIYLRRYSTNEPEQKTIVKLPSTGTTRSEMSTVFLSEEITSYMPRSRNIAAGGRMKNIFFSGQLCCKSTSYYDISWQDNDVCVNGGDNSLEVGFCIVFIGD